MCQYVTYTRVGTAEQGRSGLRLEAQELDSGLSPHQQLLEVPWGIAGEYQDVQSGGDDDRPQLRVATERCRRTGAELLWRS